MNRVAKERWEVNSYRYRLVSGLIRSMVSSYHAVISFNSA